jgi:hypothetical protein
VNVCVFSSWRRSSLLRHEGVAIFRRQGLRSDSCSIPLYFSIHSTHSFILSPLSTTFDLYSIPLPPSMTYPNQLFSAFSFIGFLLCAIPLYWHLEGEPFPDLPLVIILDTPLKLSLECWHFFVHSLGWPRLFESFHQLGRLEQHSVKRSSNLV